MMYSLRIEQAIRAACVLHSGQLRKGAPYPYVSHLFSVASIIADYTKDEDIVIAGLLHDTLEDTEYTTEELELDFGPRVKEIVLGVSERTDIRDARPWLARKEGYLEGLKIASLESLIVAAADSIHNMRSIVEEYADNFDGYLKTFGGTFDERLRLHEEKSDILNNRLQNDILNEFNHVYDEYKAFIFPNIQTV